MTHLSGTPKVYELSAEKQHKLDCIYYGLGLLSGQPGDLKVDVTEASADILCQALDEFGYPSSPVELDSMIDKLHFIFEEQRFKDEIKRQNLDYFDY